MRNIPLRRHVLDLNTCYPDFPTRHLRILHSVIFFLVLLHYFMHRSRRFLDNLFQEDDRTLPRAHSLHETIVDMYQIFCPWVSHQLKDFEKLCKVKILLRRDNPNHFIWLILFHTLDCTTDVTGKIYRSSIYTFEYQFDFS